jgi:hypothetical protein
LEIGNLSGANTLRSGTTERQANALPWIGRRYIRAAHNLSLSLIKPSFKFAGITAGRAQSFFDFYAHDLELSSKTAGSDLGSTNLIAYTATLGGGLSATLSMEDPTARRRHAF